MKHWLTICSLLCVMVLCMGLSQRQHAMLRVVAGQQRAEAVSATGGTVTNYTENGTNFTAHIFLTDNTFTVSGGSLGVEALVVAGGGGGGVSWGGGGGAGGVIVTNVNLVSASYPIVIGTGGFGSIRSLRFPDNGSNTTFNGLVAVGGGKGAYDIYAAGSGGSGGGSSYSATGVSGSGVDGQGFAGGSSIKLYAGSGGGGASEVGHAASSGTVAGDGGEGIANSFLSGTDIYYGGGGGGSVYLGATNAIGGLGGGGAGANHPSILNGDDGVAGLGGGGGAGADTGNNTGGNGGSGIVIIRYVK